MGAILDKANEAHSQLLQSVVRIRSLCSFVTPEPSWVLMGATALFSASRKHVDSSISEKLCRHPHRARDDINRAQLDPLRTHHSLRHVGLSSYRVPRGLSLRKRDQ